MACTACVWVDWFLGGEGCLVVSIHLHGASHHRFAIHFRSEPIKDHYLTQCQTGDDANDASSVPKPSSKENKPPAKTGKPASAAPVAKPAVSQRDQKPARGGDRGGRGRGRGDRGDRGGLSCLVIGLPHANGIRLSRRRSTPKKLWR
jgi:hypothetical protein